MDNKKVYEIVHSRITITGTSDVLLQGERLTVAKLRERGIDVETMERVGAIKEYVEPVVEGAEKPDESAAVARVAELEVELAKSNSKASELVDLLAGKDDRIANMVENYVPKSQVTSRDARIAEAEAEVKKLTTERKQFSEKISSLEKENAKLTADLKSANELLSKTPANP